ncbi:4Fe-4S binding protein [Terrabacter sp. NPDC080008]|uniref:NuoI/complex I 23 kDa subunit family protein n=1 Tax=Terrabacter sp. NPDC080008 TaxID=3155176 RepID=UPI00344ED660
MGDGILPGLVKGLATTAKSLTRHTHTAEYPDVAPALPPRSRGVIALTEENCTSCMLCARECPDWCIYIDSHKEELPPTTPGGRARQRNVLDRFAIDFSLCMYCGICIEVCPFDALHWSPEFEYAEVDIRDLLHEKDRLGAWMATVPPPPALDPGSADPAEVAAAARPPRGSAGGSTGAAGAPARPTRVRRQPGATVPTPSAASSSPATPTTPQATSTTPQATPPAVERTKVMPAVEAPQAEAPGTVAPPSSAEQTAPIPVAEAADAAAAQGDSTQVLPTVSTDESAADDHDGGSSGSAGSDTGGGA